MTPTMTTTMTSSDRATDPDPETVTGPVTERATDPAVWDRPRDLTEADLVRITVTCLSVTACAINHVRPPPTTRGR